MGWLRPSSIITSAARPRNRTPAEALLNMLETRLDNVVYRLGFSSSRPQARQFVHHGHITINGHGRPISRRCLVRAGQVIGVKDERGIEGESGPCSPPRTRPAASWLNLDKDNVQGTVVRLPGPEDTKDMAVNMQLIVELYSK